MDGDGLWSIGELARRTGLPVKVVRHWSDLGVVPATGRSAGGYRRFDARALARLELARTLRELGLGMAAIREVVDRERSIAEAATVHAAAIEARERFGPAPGWRLVEQVVIEMLVHGWDLARATGRPTDLAPDAAEAVLPSVRAMYGDLPRTPGGSFGPEQPVPADATAADRLAAYLGRRQEPVSRPSAR